MAELSWRLDLRSAQGRQTRILILGAGLSGLCTAMLVAREGYQVTVLERDPAVPPRPERADAAWEGWQRRAGSVSISMRNRPCAARPEAWKS